MIALCATGLAALAGAHASITSEPARSALLMSATLTVRLARVTGQDVIPLDAGCGVEGPRKLAVIDEAWCIGCTLCLDVCPVDCIVGAPKRMHTVIDADCTGCELCVPVCPVDCIALVNATPGRSGWAAWSTLQADAARADYAWHRERLARARREHDARLAARAP